MPSTPSSPAKRKSFEEVKAFGRRMSLASTKSSRTEKTLKRLPSAAHYTEDILHERLVYITKIMRENERSRVLTPMSLLLLGSYQATIGMYLHFPDHMVDRDECMAKMMSIDEFFEENNGMLEKMDPECIEMEDKMTQLKRLEFYARYGDYFGGELKVLKDNALKMQTEDHNELRQYWTEIAPKIRREKWTAEHNSEEAKIPHNVKTWNAVHSAAVAIGQDPEYIYHVIMGYAARNEIVHGPVDSYFQGAKFMDLAQRLHEDEQLLARMKHMVPPGEIAALQGIITRKIDKYFTRSDDPKFRDNYQTWTIKELGWEVVRSKERAEEERQKDLKAMNEQRRRAEENRLKRARVIDDLINDNRRTRKKLEDDLSPEQMEVWQSNSNDMKAVISIKQRSIADSDKADDMFNKLVRKHSTEFLGDEE